MRAQWRLQKQIVGRYREFGIAGHQPAFGGYAPWALAVVQNDTKGPGPHATRGVPGKDFDTAWLDGRDSLYTKVQPLPARSRRSAAPPSHFSGCFNSTGEGMSAV